MHSKSNNIKFMFYNDANKVVNEPFESRHSRYHGNLETSMEGSDSFFCIKLFFLHFIKPFTITYIETQY